MKIITENCGQVLIPEVLDIVQHHLNRINYQSTTLSIDAERVFLGIYRHHRNYTKHYNAHNFKELLSFSAALKLPAKDLEAIINFAPVSLLELYICVPDLDEKISPEKVEAFMELLMRVNLPVMKYKLQQYQREFEEAPENDSEEGSDEDDE